MEPANFSEQQSQEDGPNAYTEKFESFFQQPLYKKQVERLSKEYPDKRSVNIDFNDLEKFDPELAHELIKNPDHVLEAAHEAVKHMDLPVLEISEFTPHVRIFNLPLDQQFLIRDIEAKHLNRLIAVEGIVRQFNQVQPKLKIAAWVCRRCKNVYNVPQEGFNPKKPGVCECKAREFELSESKSVFENHQKVGIQESLERLKGGEQATTLDIHVMDDLVNRVTPGEKTIVTGILRLYPPKDGKSVFGRYLEAISTEEKQKEFMDVEVTKEEQEEIEKLAKDPNIYLKLVQSIAPSIYGHESVKEAIALQLFSGVKKTLPGNLTVRGNVHVLLMGDPGVAKSQLLRQVDLIAPKSIYVAGKTTSGVGLTASAEKDEFGEGGWTLKAGALVLASGGMVMIDEFDKIDQEDRSAMHEAMEQGTISVAKAGIVTTFKTDTSILAAANPKYSRFDVNEPFLAQIELPPTLLSRFDLMFPIRDVLDRKRDENIANFILKRHRQGERVVIAKHQKRNVDAELKEDQVETPISHDLLRKYISLARQRIFPVMTDEAMQSIQEFYLTLRDMGRKDNLFTVTARQLEALVRLSEASARIRLSPEVELSDTERSIRIFRNSLQEMALDKETGKIDIDIITTGQAHSKISHLKKILQIVRELSEDGKMNANVEDVLRQCQENNLTIEKSQEMIQELKKKGDIYEPKHGFLKPVDKRTDG